LNINFRLEISGREVTRVRGCFGGTWTTAALVTIWRELNQPDRRLRHDLGDRREPRTDFRD